MLISREVAAQLGQETFYLLKNRYYTTPQGGRVALGLWIEHAKRGTVAYPPGQLPPQPASRFAQTEIVVTNQTTMEAAQELFAQGNRVAALNFASATDPGGGFLSGSRAQEEALTRSSTLYSCLNEQPFYAYHKAELNAMYSDYTLYSPDVLFFRNDAGDLREEPYPCSIITAAAPNAKALAKYEPKRLDEIPAAFRARITTVLSIAAWHGHDTLILGAWGCGAFGNAGEMVAPLFAEALQGPFRQVFRHVRFAVWDFSVEQHFITPFRNALEPPDHRMVAS
jgi:uncharacterized protein (TIGR02452 family)